MKTNAFGFAYFIKYDDVQPGMLLTGRTKSGDQFFGLAIQAEREIIVGVFWTTQNIAVPYEIELSDILQTLAQVDGVLEVEPSELARPFAPPERQASQEGIYIGADGSVGLATSFEDWPGRQRRRYVRFEDGLADTNSGTISFPIEPRLFIAQAGRKQRFEITSAGTR